MENSKPKISQTKNFKHPDSTTLFRITNPELFIRPNLKKPSHRLLMGFGLITITFCMGYLIYMNKNYDDELHKQNLNLNYSEQKRPKSRWD